MIRTDRMHQWADTQMHAEPVKPLPRGCDQQGRYPCAAEAATEVGAEDPHEWITPGRFWALYLIAFVLALVGASVWGM